MWQNLDNKRAQDLDPDLTPSAIIQTKSLAHLEQYDATDLRTAAYAAE